MANYSELVKALRHLDTMNICPCEADDLCKYDDCIVYQAADAIEELQKRIQPWKDYEIVGTEFMSHAGPNGYQIYFSTDSEISYRIVERECRRQVEHKPGDDFKKMEAFI